MSPAPDPEFAIARWLAHGTTSLTHPLLRRAMALHFGRLGIEADWLEFEPFGALEAGQIHCSLRKPRWNPALIDPAHPGAAELERLAGHGDGCLVSADGILRFPPGTPDSWPAVVQSLRAASAAGVFLCTAAAALFTDPLATQLYCCAAEGVFADEISRRIARESPVAGPADQDRTRDEKDDRSGVRKIPDGDARLAAGRRGPTAALALTVAPPLPMGARRGLPQGHSAAPVR